VLQQFVYLSGEVANISQTNMCQIMKDVVHDTLEGGSSFFETKGHDMIGKSSPRCGKSGLVLFDMVDLNLIIP